MHIFDFYLFSKITATVYRDLKSPFSLDEVLDIFDYFFQAYEEAMGEPHPAIRREQIRNIIERMPYTSREGCGFAPRRQDKAQAGKRLVPFPDKTTRGQ